MKFKAIVFDFGNVIMDINIPLTFQRFAEISGKNQAQIERQFVDNQLFMRYETGQFSDDEFREIVRQTIGYPFSDREIDEAWNVLLLDIPKERITLLKHLRKKYPIYLLSNTNALHMKEVKKYLQKSFGIAGLEALFDKPFLSYEMELWKPNPEIYWSVLKKIKLNPKDILFLDDNKANIESAKKIGIQTIFVEPPKSIIDYFSELKIA